MTRSKASWMWASGFDLLPLLWIARREPMAKVVVYPADHFIWREARFTSSVREALGDEERLFDRLILLGVEADDPDPGYGWIDPAEPIQASDSLLLQVVRNVYWSDWGDPERIVRTVRRFSRRPTWMPAYALAEVIVAGA